MYAQLSVKMIFNCGQKNEYFCDCCKTSIHFYFFILANNTRAARFFVQTVNANEEVDHNYCPNYCTDESLPSAENNLYESHDYTNSHEDQVEFHFGWIVLLEFN